MEIIKIICEASIVAIILITINGWNKLNEIKRDPIPFLALTALFTFGIYWACEAFVFNRLTGDDRFTAQLTLFGVGFMLVVGVFVSFLGKKK